MKAMGKWLSSGGDDHVETFRLPKGVTEGFHELVDRTCAARRGGETESLETRGKSPVEAHREASSCVERLIPEEDTGHCAEDIENICAEELSGAATTIDMRAEKGDGLSMHDEEGHATRGHEPVTGVSLLKMSGVTRAERLMEQWHTADWQITQKNQAWKRRGPAY